MPLEELFVQVEQCIAQLENPQISLEDAFRHYEEGIKKLRACNEKVDQIEKKMMFVNSQGELEDFD
ncbi:MAG: exodeoxyribonuclease VII small subunit [Eubacterium sp.]|nr:exodeoxyribonuclease VII small subunit [Eubacterium sp.]